MKPLLRKTTLNTEILKNYGPVSNLSFLSKILEKVVFRQLSSHLLTNILFCSHQSAYRAGHSTVHDLLSALDEDKVSLLDLVLDLSAAFGAIDHSILLSRLSYSFAISDTVLAWFTSYLIVRTQINSVNGYKSLPAPIHYGVPKGSVLGPILFVLYTQPLSMITQHHSLYHHSFSNDYQLYISANLA